MVEVKKRETNKIIEIEDRKFKLKDFDPLLGNYILMKLITMVLPFGISDMIGAKIPEGSEVIKSSSDKKEYMSKSDFIELQRDILSNVFEILPSGDVPVIRENGTYGIDLFTMDIALKLLIEEVIYNFGDFFGELQSK